MHSIKYIAKTQIKNLIFEVFYFPDDILLSPETDTSGRSTTEPVQTGVIGLGEDWTVVFQQAEKERSDMSKIGIIRIWLIVFMVPMSGLEPPTSAL